VAGLKDRIYRKLPIPLQHGVVSAFGLYWNRYRFSGKFSTELQGFLTREYYTREKWKSYQEHQLRTLLMMAFQRVPYYRDTWKRLGIHEAQLQQFTLEDLSWLPLVEKQVARDNPMSLLVDGVPSKRHTIAHTSGSTGMPVATYWLPEERQRSLAIREGRECHFARVSYRLPRATFSGRIVEPNPESKGPFHRYNIVEKQVYFSAFHLRPENAAIYIKPLIDHQIVWMNGYANSIYQLAQMVIDQKIRAPKLKAVITTSEKLTDEMQQVINKAFSTRTYDQYGCVEDAFYACTCEYGHMHISPDAGVLEILDDNYQPVPVGTMGEVVVTSFIRPSQPLIRYRVGDRAILSDEPCSCGREMPVLSEIVGRLEDTVYAADGRRMVRFHGIFANQPHIREGQIVQEAIDLICVRIVPKPGFSEADKQDVVGRIQQRLTAQMRVIVEVVDQLERTPNGKLRAVVSKLPKEQIIALNSMQSRDTKR